MNIKKSIVVLIIISVALAGCSSGSNSRSSGGEDREQRPGATIEAPEIPSFDLPETPDTPAEPQIPNGAIDWTEAAQHVGESITVYGRVAGATYASSSNGRPTFINIGADYPDASRVTVVIWDEDRARFSGVPDEIYLGKTICVTGVPYLYDGVCNIEVQSPSQIQVMG
jgi:hypothetical protein